MDSFANRFRILLDERGVTQAYISRLLGVSRSVVCQYLTGRSEPRQEKLAKLALFFNVSEAWLLGYDCERTRVNVVNSAEAELLRIYKLLDTKGKTKLMALAYTLEEEHGEH